MVKVWDPSDWTMSELVEVYVPKTATLNDFGLLLNGKFGHIKLADLECTKINSSWNFSRVQLPFESWTKLEGSELFMGSAPYYVQTDGLFFVIRDSKKDVRDMTADEKELYRSDDYEHQIFSRPIGKTADGKPKYSSGRPAE